LIHALEFQHAGYLLNELLKEYPEIRLSTRIAASNWGSDIKYYKNYYRHLEVMSELLSKVEILFVECERDKDYAISLFDFKGKIFKVVNAVGVDIEFTKVLSKKIPTVSRKFIILKGYESIFGRVSIALRALEDIGAPLIANKFQLLVYSATNDAIKIINEINKRGIIHIKILPVVNNTELLRYFSQSIIYIGLGVSDGISISALEAMACGAIPIQTNTSCCHEWIKDGISGFIIPLDAEALKVAIKSILNNKIEVENAAMINLKTIEQFANFKLNADILVEHYSLILNN
jgi:glycosyltransferase involved in cell wall biosynthesis